MVKHIVMWKLVDVAEGCSRGDNAKRIKTGLEALTDSVDGLLNLEVGFGCNPKGFDLVLNSEFQSREAVQEFERTPGYQNLRIFIRKVISERVSADYEM